MREERIAPQKNGQRRRMDAEPRGYRTVLGLSVFAVVGWSLLVVVLFRDWGRPREPDLRQVMTHHGETATQEGPPVIRLRDLDSLQFEPRVIQDIEPHFHVLNAALVTLVELHLDHDSELEPQRKQAIEQSASSFHVTADLHEELIEARLPPQLVAAFHAYMRAKETAAGLPNDERWHRHDSGTHRTERPTLDHDTVIVSREGQQRN